MERTKLGKGIMELVGTGLFLLTIQTSVSLGSSQAAVAIGVALITLVYAGGPISGAHYNPAISLSVMMRGKMSAGDMIYYWVCQIVGGYVGSLLGGIVAGSFSVVALGAGSSTLQAMVAEICFTFMLCFVVLGVATHSKADGNSHYGAAIGLVVMAGAITVGPVSGGAFNPAVALGLCIAKGFAGISYTLSVVVANLIGGVLAAIVFKLAAPDQFDDAGASAAETANLV